MPGFHDVMKKLPKSAQSNLCRRGGSGWPLDAKQSMTREPESLDVTKYKTNDKIEKPLKKPPRNIHKKINLDESKGLCRGAELCLCYY